MSELTKQIGRRLLDTRIELQESKGKIVKTAYQSGYVLWIVFRDDTFVAYSGQEDMEGEGRAEIIPYELREDLIGVSLQTLLFVGLITDSEKTAMEKEESERRQRQEEKYERDTLQRLKEKYES